MQYRCSGFIVLSFLLLWRTTPPVQAQQTPTAPPVPSTTTDTTANPSKAPVQNVQAILNQMRRETNANLLVTSELAQKTVVPPKNAATPETLEETLDTLVKRIPLATWARVYLPPPASGRRYTGDAVAQFVSAQTALFGRQPKPDATTVIILGKTMPMAEAEPYIRGLNLEPYYVVLSRRALTDPVMIPGLGGATGIRQQDPVTAALLKQLGVNNVRDVPSGNYVVPVVGADGTTRQAHVTVTNEQGRTRIQVFLTDSVQP